MPNYDTITIPLVLPFDEAAALAQFVKRTTYDDVGQAVSMFVFYNGRTEQDVAWSRRLLVATPAGRRRLQSEVGRGL